MEIVKVPTVKRDSFGKKGRASLKKTGTIPAVLYGGKENVHFGLQKNDVKSLVYTPEFKIAELAVEGATLKSIIKDIQFHPVTDEILHMDFLELVDGQALMADIPVSCKGTSEGQRAGGKLVQKLRKVTVKTTPEHLVSQLVVDITTLELNESVRVNDIDKVDGIQIMNVGATPVASIEVPRALKSAQAEEEAGEATAEGAEGEEAAAAEAPAAE